LRQNQNALGCAPLSPNYVKVFTVIFDKSLLESRRNAVDFAIGANRNIILLLYYLANIREVRERKTHKHSYRLSWAI